MENISSNPFSGKLQFEVRPTGKPGIMPLNSLLIVPTLQGPFSPTWGQFDVWDLSSTPTFRFTLGDNTPNAFFPPKEGNGFLFIPGASCSMQIWHIETGKKIELESHWKHIITRLTVSKDFTAHTTLYNDRTIYISDPNTFKLIKKIPMKSKICDIKISEGKLFVFSNLGEEKKGLLTVYKNPLESDANISTSFPHTGSTGYMDSLDVSDGMIYNHTWYSKMNFIWDENTLDVLLETSREENQLYFKTILLTPFAAVIDQKQDVISIFEKQSDQSQFVHLYDYPIFGKQNGLTELIQIQFSNQTLGCAGFGDGKVQIWDLKTGKSFAELSPLPGMEYASALQMIKGRLVVHYDSASEDGTIGIIWDLETKAPFFNITIDSLAHKNYQDGQWDDLLVTDEGNLIVRCQDQAIIYKSNADSDLGRMLRARHTGSKIEQVQKPILKTNLSKEETPQTSTCVLL